VSRPRPLLHGVLAALDAQLSRLARSQGGVVTAVQARGLGAADADIRTLLRSGWWERMRRGVYRDRRAVWPGEHQDLAAQTAAAVAALTGDVYASGPCCAALLDLPLPPRFRPEVEIARRAPSHGNPPAGVRVRVVQIDERSVTHRRGIPLLGGAAVVADCARELSPPDALAIADAALRRGICTPEDLAEHLVGRHGLPRAGQVGTVISRADGRAESWLESVSRWWILEDGLPVPQLQVELDGPDGVARLDMLFPEHGVAGEADGLGKYSGPDGVEVLAREKRRDAWIRDMYGFEVLHWMPADVASPQRRRLWLGQLHRALVRGAAEQRRRRPSA